MRHIRNKVISDIASLLSAAPVNWDRVFTQRIMTERTLRTYLIVYFESESAEKLNISAPATYRMTVQLHIDAVMRIADYEDLELAIGNVAGEIQTKVTELTVAAASADVTAISLIDTSVSINEDQPAFAIMGQTWLVTYMMTDGSPLVA